MGKIICEDIKLYRTDADFLSADFRELSNTAVSEAVHVAVSEKMFRGVTPSFHLSSYQFSILSQSIF